MERGQITFLNVCFISFRCQLQLPLTGHPILGTSGKGQPCIVNFRVSRTEQVKIHIRFGIQICIKFIFVVRQISG